MWSTKDLQQAQLEDRDITPMVRWLGESEPRPCWETVAPHSEATKIYWAQWDSLKLCDGVVYRVWETPAGDKAVWQLVLPKKLRPKVLYQLHNTAAAGHLGVAKTLGRVRERFYWIRYHTDVQDWCRKCDMCASKRGPPKKSVLQWKNTMWVLQWKELPLTSWDSCHYRNQETNTC